MNKLPIKKKAHLIQLIAEGNSLRSCSRIADVSFNTVLKLLVDVGKACIKFHSQTVVQVRSQRVQCDEIWSFVYSKNKNTPEGAKGIGDMWTWTAMDADSKLLISWYVGDRSLESARFLMNDLWCRLRTRVQLTTDGFPAYVEAVADTFGGKVDFGQVVKQYKANQPDKKGKVIKAERYVGAERRVISGQPDKTKISTSHIERQNMTIRMTNRRYTRDVDAFSKKYENHCYATALNFVYYNFVRIHKTLRVTPAMESKLVKKPMTFEEIANLVDNFSK